jgi:hypothetical protein
MSKYLERQHLPQVLSDSLHCKQFVTHGYPTCTLLFRDQCPFGRHLVSPSQSVSKLIVFEKMKMRKFSSNSKPDCRTVLTESCPIFHGLGVNITNKFLHSTSKIRIANSVTRTTRRDKNPNGENREANSFKRRVHDSLKLLRETSLKKTSQ